MAVPGWPEFAACTASIDSVRMVLMAFCSAASWALSASIFALSLPMCDLPGRRWNWWRRRLDCPPPACQPWALTFFLALGQAGAEQALVDETGLSRAYSKRGLVTLKSTRDLGIDNVPMPVFARHIGLSLGKVDDEAAARAAAAALGIAPDLVAGARPPKRGEIVLTLVDGWATV